MLVPEIKYSKTLMTTHLYGSFSKYKITKYLVRNQVLRFILRFFARLFSFISSQAEREWAVLVGLGVMPYEAFGASPALPHTASCLSATAEHRAKPTPRSGTTETSLCHSPRLIGCAPCSFRRCREWTLRPLIYFPLV